MKCTWNTGRRYTIEGQIITAEQWGGTILFHDHTRMVCGAIDREFEQKLGDAELRRVVMAFYDKLQYKYDRRACELEVNDVTI